MSKPDWENFAKAVLADWPTDDLEGSVLFDLSLQYGMIQEVPGGYNSEHHIDADGVCPEEGDPWYEYTFRGEAGPGLYSIHVLTEQLKTCRMAQVVMDNTVAELEAKLSTCEEIGRAFEEDAGQLRDKLAKVVEALRAFKDFDDMPTSYKRPDVFELRVRRKLLATLAEIEGSDAP
jgi:hypothetical protein